MKPLAARSSFRVYLLVLSAPLVASQPALAQTSAPASAPARPSIEGIVVNHFGGGVQSAQVIIETESGAKLGEARTNATGEWAVFGKPITGKVQVRIRKEGYAELTQEVEAAPDDDQPPYVDVTLEGSNSLSGTVRTKVGGRPVAGATVRCSNGGQDQNAKTDAQGRYTLNGLIAGQAQLTVSADGYAIAQKNAKVDGPESTADIELSRQRSVELTITTPDGQPAEKVLIEALAEPAETLLTAVTDARGRAQLNGIGADAELIRLRLNGDNYVRMSGFEQGIELTATQPEGEADSLAPIRKRLTISVGAALTGHVLDEASGEPVVGARVAAGRELQSRMAMTWTGMDGSYELRGLPPGANTISYQHGEHAPLVREIELSAARPATAEVKMGPGAPVAGLVVDEAGKPLSEVWIVLAKWQDYRTIGMRTYSDAEGRFELPHVPAGPTEFAFFRQGFEPITGEALTAGKRDYRVVLKPTTAPADVAEGGERLKVGQEVPDFAVTATDGTSYKLSALRGKYVFLDCWASWCGPCMAEVPNVKALHKALKTRPDFVLVGISLDHNEKAFKKALSDKGMEWPQAFGPKSGASEAFEILDGFGIPYTCLIGPDGKLLAQHLRGEGIVEQVQKLLK